MGEAFSQGLVITVLGMGLVFLALIILWWMMKALTWVFRAQPEPSAPAEAPEDDLALAAAVGWALAAAEAERDLPASGWQEEAGPRPWTAAGRARQVHGWRRSGRTSYWLPGR